MSRFPTACPGEFKAAPRAEDAPDGDTDFRDPVVPAEESWLAGFAPVRQTGFLGIVLQQDVDASSPWS